MSAKDLVRAQRLSCVTSGGWFAQFNTKGRTNTYRFYKVRWKLHKNPCGTNGESLRREGAGEIVLRSFHCFSHSAVGQQEELALQRGRRAQGDQPRTGQHAQSRSVSPPSRRRPCVHERAEPANAVCRRVPEPAVEMAQVFDIKTGQASPLVAASEKARKKGADDFQPHLTFSLMSQDGETSLADFVCENDTVFAEWVDGYVSTRTRLGGRQQF